MKRKTDRREALMKAYPRLFKCGMAIGDGWVGIVEMLARAIDDYCTNTTLLDGKPRHPEYPVINDVKEKFGQMSVYHNGDATVHGMVAMAETMSWYTCEMCGSTEDIRHTKGWIVTLCPKCMKAYKKEHGRT